MRDIELYKTILGLTPPWTVVRVDLDVKRPQVAVRVRARSGPSLSRVPDDDAGV